MWNPHKKFDHKLEATKQRPKKTQSNGYTITISKIQDDTWGINISQNKQISMIKCQKQTNVMSLSLKKKKKTN